MKKIIPSNGAGLEILIDDEDYPVLSRLSWQLDKDGFAYNQTLLPSPNKYHVHARVLITRFLIQQCGAMMVRHKDGNKLNNCKDNLILQHRSYFSQAKRKYSTHRGVPCTSKYKGVHKHRRKWVSVISRFKVVYQLGSFYDEVEAALAYDKKARELYGELAYQNFARRKNAKEI